MSTVVADITSYMQIVGSVITVGAMIAGYYKLSGQREAESKALVKQFDKFASAFEARLDKFEAGFDRTERLMQDQAIAIERHNGRLNQLEQGALETIRVRQEWSEWRNRFGNRFS